MVQRLPHLKLDIRDTTFMLYICATQHKNEMSSFEFGLSMKKSLTCKKYMFLG